MFKSIEYKLIIYLLVLMVSLVAATLLLVRGNRLWCGMCGYSCILFIQTVQKLQEVQQEYPVSAECDGER